MSDTANVLALLSIFIACLLLGLTESYLALSIEAVMTVTPMRTNSRVFPNLSTNSR